MEYDLQLIGARLQAARKAKGYTQDYVSARADITEKFLSQIERGKAGLSVQTLIALCEYFRNHAELCAAAGKTPRASCWRSRLALC